MGNVIEISNLTKKYGSATVLNNVNISFEEGKIENPEEEVRGLVFDSRRVQPG